LGMDMDVDKPRTHHPTGRVDLRPRRSRAQVADRLDPITPDTDIGALCGVARAVNNCPVTDDNVEFHAPSPTGLLESSASQRWPDSIDLIALEDEHLLVQVHRLVAV